MDRILVSNSVLSVIQRSGFLPWGTIMETNHHTGYTDFNTDILFGASKDPTHHSHRTLTTDYPTAVKQHLEIVNEEFKIRHMHENISKLVNEAKWHRWSNKFQRKYNARDSKVTKTMLQAEKHTYLHIQTTQNTVHH